MSQNDLLVDVLRRNLVMLQSTLADMTDADLIQRPVPGANNGLWQIGHLINSESRLVNGGAGRIVIELPAGFADRYNTKTASIDDPAKLGNKPDLLAIFGEVREKTCQWAASLTTAMIIGFGLLVWLPTLFANTHQLFNWAGNGVNLAIAGAAWIVADSLGPMDAG